MGLIPNVREEKKNHGSDFTGYGGLAENGSHRLRCLNPWSPLVALFGGDLEDVISQEEVCYLRFHSHMPF